MVDWNNAPDKARFYAGGHFWKNEDGPWWRYSNGVWERIPMSLKQLKSYNDYDNCEELRIAREVLENITEDAEDAEVVEVDTPDRDIPDRDIPHSGDKYLRKLVDRYGNAVIVDVYDVTDCFNVKCPAVQHAAKKLLCTGVRGHKNQLQDLHEARDALDRAIQLVDQRANRDDKED